MALAIETTLGCLGARGPCHGSRDSGRGPVRSMFQHSLCRQSGGWTRGGGLSGSRASRQRLQCFAISEPRKAETSQEVAGSNPDAEAPQQDPKQALKALDQQLSQLASSGDQPRQRPAAAAAVKATSASDLITNTPNFRRDPYPPNKAPPQFGRDASGEGWPEFDFTFFTYSCIVLLALTALTNFVYYKAAPRSQEAGAGSEAAAAAKEKKEERAAKLSALYKRSIGDSPAALEYERDAEKTAPALELE